MPLVRIAELEIDPQQTEAYKALLAEEIEASVSLEPGVLFLHAVALKDRPSSFRVFECYADVESYQLHLTTPHFLKYKAGTAGMVTSLKLVETEPVALATKALPFTA